MKLKALYIIILYLLSALTSFAQIIPVQIDSMRLEKYRTEIGLDLSVPDYDIKTIDSKIMGLRLAGILDYLMDNYNQPVYNRKLCEVLKEQVEPLEKMEFELKKIQYISSKKSGDEITLLFTAWPNKNSARIKQTNLVLNFKNGVSESQMTNELFSMMSRYVKMREELNQKK